MTSPAGRRPLIVGTALSLVAICACGGERTPQPPAPPVGLSAAPGNGSATLIWQRVEGATSYDLYWSRSAGVTRENGVRIGGASSPYVHSPLTNGATYYYVATAVGPGGESVESAQVSATPSATPQPPPTPEGLTASPSDNRIILTWLPAAGATSYNLYWSQVAGVTTANGNRIAGVSSPYVHTALASGVRYYYVVTAVGPGGESSGSAEASAVISPTGPIL